MQETIGAETTKYYYDALSRITTQLTPEGGSQNYSYDDFGNIRQMAEVGQIAGGISTISESNYSYDANNRLLLKETISGKDTQQIRFLYDKEGSQVEKAEISKYAGSLIAENTVNFYYNGYNQLAHIEDAEGRLTVYSYNGNGLRTTKESIGGETTKFYYDANANIILETDELNAVTAKNVRGLHCISRENAGEDPFYYLYNAHGDVTKLVDELGNVLTDYRYDPFGNQKQQLLNAAAGNLQFSQWQAETQQINNPFRYCGEYLDSETGNYYLRARYYDPAVQRFISEDSAKDGLNWYVYCGNNPVIFIDPSGCSFKSAAGNFFKGMGDGVVSTGKGLSSAVAHPIETAKSLGNAISHPIQTGKAVYNEVADAYDKQVTNGNADSKARFAGRVVSEIGLAAVSVKGADKVVKVSKTAKTVKVVGSKGFKTQNLLDSHYKKHANEFGDITKDQYLKGAQNLVKSKSGGNILTKTRANGDLLVYNKANNEFAVKASDGTIRTYFKPKDGIDYFNKQR